MHIKAQVPPSSNSHYYQLHETSTTETIVEIFSKYIGRAPILIGLFIMMDIAQFDKHQLISPAENIPFPVVVIHKGLTYMNSLLSIEGKRLKATASTPLGNEMHPSNTIIL